MHNIKFNSYILFDLIGLRAGEILSLFDVTLERGR